MELYRAPAKINLALEILGRRPDGFHEIASVIQAVGLYDELRVAPAETLRFICAQSALSGADNLVVRAARALQNATGCRRGAELRLCKGIPVAAGLGGGSSDAAAALVLLNRHWRLGLTLGELSRIGATLGSDIPFFLTGPTAVVSGRGERVELLPPPPLGWVVLGRPRQPLSTAAVYGALRPDSYSDGRRTRQLAAALRQGRAPRLGYHPDQRTGGDGRPAVPHHRRHPQPAARRGGVPRAGEWEWADGLCALRERDGSAADRGGGRERTRRMPCGQCRSTGGPAVG